MAYALLTADRPADAGRNGTAMNEHSLRARKRKDSGSPGDIADVMKERIRSFLLPTQSTPKAVC